MDNYQKNEEYNKLNEKYKNISPCEYTNMGPIVYFDVFTDGMRFWISKKCTQYLLLF